MKDTEQLVKLKANLISEIEAEMKETAISQGEVARRIGAKRTNINMIIRRSAPVSLDFLVKMAETIGLKVSMKVSR